MVPLEPTAQPCLASAKATPKSSALVPDFCFFQVAPPLLVAKMVPPEPTAQPRWELAKATASRMPRWPFFCLFQLVPPLLVTRMAPVLMSET